MAIFRINHKTRERLLTKPESGMGYQIIRYRSGPIVIFNATVAIPLEELREQPFDEETYAVISGNPDMESVKGDTLDIEDDILIIDLLLGTNLQTDTFGLSFSESVVKPPESIISSRIPYAYYRYSPYHIDKRVNPSTGDYLPGTYATTQSDMHFVPSGFAAVGRYALPNPASAKYIFPIVTYDKPDLMGTVAPNFGQAGGGVEVLFQNGAKNKVGTSFQINAG
nr:hypothetical protein 4 [bacterium]